MIVWRPKISLQIHPTAFVDSKAKLGSGISIGPYSIINSNVTIGDGTMIGNHVTIASGTRIGTECKIFHSSSIGEIPQDMKFAGEQTEAIIGNRTTIREFVTINRGTKASGVTVIGDDCLLMAYVHIAHDCVIGKQVIMSNMATLGGHVNIGDYVSLGGGVMIHQFCKIGEHAFIGAGYWAVQDIPPYILAAGTPLKFEWINNIGLKRRGFSVEGRKTIKDIYKLYFRSNVNRKDTIVKIYNKFPDSEYKTRILDFIQSSDRGII